MKMKHLFITGAYRSGSTLFEKLLHNHPNVGIGSQPFPYLYFKAKAKFHAKKNLKRRYPIGHLFLERDYTPQELCSFLETCSFTTDEIERMIQGMATYSGQYMPELIQFCQQVRFAPGTFYQVYQQLLSTLGSYLNKDGLSFIGTKESFCEEFIPFFLAKQHKVLVTVRDPRDIVASLNFGRGSEHGGEIRPVLYVMRQWRKSIGFCLHYQVHPDFTFVRYEDLVRDQWTVLDELTEFLGLSPFSRQTFSKGIRDQRGQVWQSNSSFGRYTSITSQSVGRFKQTLSENCVRYIETICYPELCALGYEPLYQVDGPDKKAIESFAEPTRVTHEKFDPDYSHTPRRIQEEILRLKHLQGDLGEEEQSLWYIFPDVYRTLKSVLSTRHNTSE
jgi:hypothetical protein